MQPEQSEVDGTLNTPVAELMPEPEAMYPAQGPLGLWCNTRTRAGSLYVMDGVNVVEAAPELPKLPSSVIHC